MFSVLEEMLLAYAQSLPLGVFAFVASAIEEIIAPIPSPTVMVVTGSFAHFQGYSAFGLIPLALIAALGKTFGAIVVYEIARRAEYFIMRMMGAFFNVTEADVTKLGSKLGKGKKDYVFLTFLRALPIMPSVVVSVGSGVLKVAFPLFIVSTFLGTIIRDSFYLYAGYFSIAAFQKMIVSFGRIETFIEMGTLFLVVSFVAVRVRRKITKG